MDKPAKTYYCKDIPTICKEAPMNPCKVFAHRGASHYAPENTLPAMDIPAMGRLLTGAAAGQPAPL